ncbi:hypothetical protein J5N97_028420 [Dioscorea zingiberensis]|uniref:Uncharacterized protein n=1 Tax=Dioscorea zingiberensis TaxID=325984 RepID=A0A9D5BYX1_9LILI|nr:hypothetical protein J5N97_028420 [Dioscorea zingiberensis]
MPMVKLHTKSTNFLESLVSEFSPSTSTYMGLPKEFHELCQASFDQKYLKEFYVWVQNAAVSVGDKIIGCATVAMPEAKICDAALLLMRQILNWSFKQDSSVSDPSVHSYRILGFLLILMAVPLNNNSKLGQAFARYVEKYVRGYFPMTLHIEDAKAFDPNKAFVFAVEPHSVFPLGSLSLLSITGLMPLAKTRGLVSSAPLLPICSMLLWNLISMLLPSQPLMTTMNQSTFMPLYQASRKGKDSGVVYRKDSKLKEHRVFTEEELHLEPLSEEIIENSFPC